MREYFILPPEIKPGSDRAFGLVFVAVFGIIGLWPLFYGGGVRAWAMGCAAGLLVLAFVAPGLLKPLNLAWTWLGYALHRVVTPLLMGILFFGLFMPMGLLLRLLGRRPLRLGFDRSAESYWIRREPPGPAPMDNQF